MIIRNDTITEAQLGAAVSDANAQAYINNLISKGVILTSSLASSINKLFIDLKSSDIYNGLDAFYPMIGASALTNKINAKSNDTYDLTYSGSWTFTSDGQKGNGSDTMALTNWKITTSNRYNYSFGVYLNQLTNAGVTTDMGVGIGGQNTFWFLAQYWDNYGSIFYAGDLRFNSATAATGKSFLMASRTSQSEYKGYINGNLVVTDTTTISSNTSQAESVALGCRNIDGSLNIPSSNNEMFAYVGSGLNAAKIQQLYQIVSVFLTDIGRI